MECACNVEMKGKYTLEHKWMECTYGRNALGGGRATFHSWWIHMLCNDSGMNESDSHILYSMPCENTTCVCVCVCVCVVGFKSRKNTCLCDAWANGGGKGVQWSRW